MGLSVQVWGCAWGPLGSLLEAGCDHLGTSWAQRGPVGEIVSEEARKRMEQECLFGEAGGPLRAKTEGWELKSKRKDKKRKQGQNKTRKRPTDSTRVFQALFCHSVGWPWVAQSGQARWCLQEKRNKAQRDEKTEPERTENAQWVGLASKRVSKGPKCPLFPGSWGARKRPRTY